MGPEQYFWIKYTDQDVWEIISPMYDTEEEAMSYQKGFPGSILCKSIFETEIVA